MSKFWHISCHWPNPVKAKLTFVVDFGCLSLVECITNFNIIYTCLCCTYIVGKYKPIINTIYIYGSYSCWLYINESIATVGHLLSLTS
jgi:hypothetical protein